MSANVVVLGQATASTAPVKWAAIGAGALVLGAAAVGLFIRSQQMRANRGGGPRRRRLRRWGEK